MLLLAESGIHTEAIENGKSKISIVNAAHLLSISVSENASHQYLYRVAKSLINRFYQIVSEEYISRVLSSSPQSDLSSLIGPWGFSFDDFVRRSQSDLKVLFKCYEEAFLESGLKRRVKTIFKRADGACLFGGLIFRSKLLVFTGKFLLDDYNLILSIATSRSCHQGDCWIPISLRSDQFYSFLFLSYLSKDLILFFVSGDPHSFQKLNLLQKKIQSLLVREKIFETLFNYKEEDTKETFLLIRKDNSCIQRGEMRSKSLRKLEDMDLFESVVVKCEGLVYERREDYKVYGITNDSEQFNERISALVRKM